MKRILWPTIGLVILIATGAQVRAMMRSGATTPAPAQQLAAAHVPRVSAEGRVVTYPGAEVIVGADAAGIVERLVVQEKDRVRKGDLLAVLRADDARAELAQSRAKVGEADADIRLFDAEAARMKKLFQEDIGTKEAWEKSERDLDAARARRGSSVAEVERLAALLEKTRVLAPIDGVVIARNVHPGEHIAAGDTLVTIADLTKTRVEAEVDEFDSARVALGNDVVVTAEGFDGKSWRGTIEEIPDSVVSRRLKPQDPSKPIDTRVLLVKVALAEATPLKLGQRVEVQVGSH
jgi:RND family efflux transporter MFP subunit